MSNAVTTTLERADRPLACSRCGETIAVDDHFVLRSRDAAATRAAASLHPACALDLDARAFLRLLRSNTSPFDERSSLASLAATRVAAIEARARSRWTTAQVLSGDRRGVAPAGPFEDDPALVLPACDRKGRPRVRALIHGPAAGPESELWALLREGDSWASSRREYVFVTVGGWDVVGEEDPSQPVVAVVYAARAKKNARVEADHQLWLLDALGMGPPLLWLHGIKAIQERDDNVVRIREHVEQSGIPSDSCPLLCAPRLTTDALDALVAALDEHADGRELRVKGSPALAFAQSLRRHIVDEGGAMTARTTMRLTYAGWGRTPQSRAALESIAWRLVERGDSEGAAMVLAERVSEDRVLYEQWLALERERGDQRSTAWLCSTLSAYARCGPAVDATIELALRATDRGRWLSLLNLLDRIVTPATIEAARVAIAKVQPIERQKEYARAFARWEARLAEQAARRDDRRDS